MIDNNAVIDFFSGKHTTAGTDFLNSVIDAVPNVSVISKIELLGFNTTEKHYQILLNFIKDSNVLSLTDEVVEKSIEVRKKYKTKLPDAVIAATAIVFGFVLITRNKSDFKSIDGLKLIDPYTL